MEKRNAPTLDAMIGEYVKVFIAVALHALLRLIALAPLYALVKADGSALALAALACPLLIALVVLPMRFSFAEAMAAAAHGEGFSIARSFSLARWGEKLREAAYHASRVLVWAIPLVLAAAVAVFFYFGGGSADSMTFLRAVSTIGKTVFGAEAGVMQGAALLGGAFAALFLLALFGAMRMSAYRFLWGELSASFAGVRKEARRRMRGKRGGQFARSLINPLLCLPFLAVAGFLLYRIYAAADFAAFLKNLSSVSTLVPFGVAFLTIYLPFLPLRRMITCKFALERK